MSDTNDAGFAGSPEFGGGAAPVAAVPEATAAGIPTPSGVPTTQPAGVEGDRFASAGFGQTPVNEPDPNAPQPAPPPPSYEDVFDAFLHQNGFATTMQVLSRMVEPYDPNYNPTKDPQIMGTPYEAYLRDPPFDLFRSGLIHSRSAAETRDVISSLNQREGDLSVFARGGVPGIAAGIAASFISPFMLLPFGGMLKLGEGVAAGASIGLRAAEVGVESGLAGAGQEAVNQATGARSSGGEVAFNIGLDAPIGGMLGAAAKTA
jgi:hypothetical protein